MNQVNHLNIFTRADGRYDFRILAGENGNTLAASHQGYENRAEAIEIGKRVLNAGGWVPVDPTMTFDDDFFTGGLT